MKITREKAIRMLYYKEYSEEKNELEPHFTKEKKISYLIKIMFINNGDSNDFSLLFFKSLAWRLSTVKWK